MVAALQIELDRTPREEAQTKRYWCGTLRGGPYQNTVKGYVSFCSHKGTLDQSRMNGERGNIVPLTQAQLDETIKRVKRHVVRMRGSKGKGRMISMAPGGSRDHYVQHPDDVPLGAFLYIVPVLDVMPEGWRASNPPPLWSEDRAEAPDDDLPSRTPARSQPSAPSESTPEPDADESQDVPEDSAEAPDEGSPDVPEGDPAAEPETASEPEEGFEDDGQGDEPEDAPPAG